MYNNTVGPPFRAEFLESIGGFTLTSRRIQAEEAVRSFACNFNQLFEYTRNSERSAHTHGEPLAPNAFFMATKACWQTRRREWTKGGTDERLRAPWSSAVSGLSAADRWMPTSDRLDWHPPCSASSPEWKIFYKRTGNWRAKPTFSRIYPALAYPRSRHPSRRIFTPIGRLLAI